MITYDERREVWIKLTEARYIATKFLYEVHKIKLKEDAKVYLYLYRVRSK